MFSDEDLDVRKVIVQLVPRGIKLKSNNTNV
jgi:hypothetical protein